MDWNKKHNDLERLLIKTPLEPFTPYLFDCLKQIASGEYSITNKLVEAEKRKAEAAQLSKALLASLNNEPVRIGNNKVTSKGALSVLREALTQEYKNRGLDYRCRTPEESKEQLKNWRTNDEAKDWLHEVLMDEAQEVCSPDEIFITDEDFESASSDPEYIEEYSFERVKVEVTPKEVERTIKANTTSRKRGRPSKNDHLKWFILEVRKYYRKRNNKIYGLLFDCLDLFGLIDEEVKRPWHYKEQPLSYSQKIYIRAEYKKALKLESELGSVLELTKRPDLELLKHQ